MIRAAAPEDIFSLLELGEAFFIESGHAEKGWQFDQQSFAITVGTLIDHGLMLVLEEGGRVVGMAAADAARAFWNHSVVVGREAFWFVEPAYRKGKDSRKLLTSLEVNAKMVGVHIFDVVAEDGERSEALARLYRGAGYRPAERTFRKVL